MTIETRSLLSSRNRRLAASLASAGLLLIASGAQAAPGYDHEGDHRARHGVIRQHDHCNDRHRIDGFDRYHRRTWNHVRDHRWHRDPYARNDRGYRHDVDRRHWRDHDDHDRGGFFGRW